MEFDRSQSPFFEVSYDESARTNSPVRGNGPDSNMETESLPTVELHIRGPEPRQRLQLTISSGEVVRIGRSLRSGCPIPWDLQISREHADLYADTWKLTLNCLPHAPNPIRFKGRSLRKAVLTPGDVFEIGTTVFQVRVPRDDKQPEAESVKLDSAPGRFLGAASAEPMSEFKYSAEDLQSFPFSHAAEQLEILAQLPDLISESHGDDELAGLLVKLLLKAMPQAVGVAVVRFDTADLDDAEQQADPPLLRFETRNDYYGQFRPSKRLMHEALVSLQSVMHIWGSQDISYTVTPGLDWAFASPLRGESCRGWCLYVSGDPGEGGSRLRERLTGDLRFTELVAQFISSVRQVRLLQEQKTQLSRFFSPTVIQGLQGHSWEDVLKPLERDITVLFCDLRGFSQRSELLQNDLLRLLNSVSVSLGVMANGVLERDGAIADFQGDSVLGFWGWPVPVDDGPVLACRAALEILAGFRRESETDNSQLLEGFSVGIGIAHGRALAGRIGTEQQSKIGVFGPVVNQGSRLEGLTRYFDVSICVDDATAVRVRDTLDPTESRLRRIANVRPKGMETPIAVHELLATERHATEFSDQMIARYESALDAAMTGEWDTAASLLNDCNVEDGPTRRLRSVIVQHQQNPSMHWDGVISMISK